MTTGGTVPEGLDPSVTKRDIHFVVEAHNVDPMLKLGRVSHNNLKFYTLACDEGEQLGGQASAPPPLAYFSAAYAF
jgi:hypothetical protein